MLCRRGHYCLCDDSDVLAVDFCLVLNLNNKISSRKSRLARRQLQETGLTLDHDHDSFPQTAPLASSADPFLESMVGIYQCLVDSAIRGQVLQGCHPNLVAMFVGVIVNIIIIIRVDVDVVVEDNNCEG